MNTQQLLMDYLTHIIISVVFVCNQVKTWEGMYDPSVEYRKTLINKEVRPLIWYPTVYFLISFLPLINRWATCLAAGLCCCCHAYCSSLLHEGLCLMRVPHHTCPSIYSMCSHHHCKVRGHQLHVPGMLKHTLCFLHLPLIPHF